MHSILELGPGRGTLMRDMRHVWAMLMPDLAGASVHFVETSPTLRGSASDRRRRG